MRYDILERGKDGKIPVGSSCTIKIDPDDPSRVMGNCKTYAATPAIFAFCALVASIVLTILATR